MKAGLYNASKYYMEFNKAIVKPGYFNQYLAGIRKDLFNYRVNGYGFIGHAAPEFTPKTTTMSVLMPLYTTLHESIHLAQDYQLGALYLEDFYTDYGRLGGVFCSIHANVKKQILTVFPLKEYDDWDVSMKQFWCVNYHGIFDHEQRYTIPNDTTVHKLSMRDLLEGYASAKSFWLLTSYEDSLAGEPGSGNAQLQDEHMLFHPFKLDCHYRKAWDIFKLRLNFNSNNETGFLVYLCDFALNIPAPNIIRDYVENKGMKYEEFSPPYRYYKCIETIHKNRGFPDKIDNLSAYQTTFDFIALENQWPSFSETIGSWLNFYDCRMKQGFMISDAYKYMALLYRLQQLDESVLQDPSLFFGEIGLPILIRYAAPDSMMIELCQRLGNGLFPLSDSYDPFFLDPLYIMQTGYNHYDYGKFIKQMTDEPLMFGLTAKPVYLRELLCRIIAKAFSKAACSCHSFTCPLVEWKCKQQTRKCCQMTQLNHLNDNCGLKIWLDDQKIDRSLIVWEG